MSTPPKQASSKPVLRDLKESLSNNRKPDLTHVRVPFMNYTARSCELGDDRYQRGNYLRPIAPGGYTGTPTAEDFRRFRAYLRAGVSHIMETLDAMERHQSTDPDFLDIEGMKRAAYAEDLDVSPGNKIGASKLPHVAPACSSLQMAICQAVECGLLPRDPGTPWKQTAVLKPYASPSWPSESYVQGAEAGIDVPVIIDDKTGIAPPFHPSDDCHCAECAGRKARGETVLGSKGLSW